MPKSNVRDLKEPADIVRLSVIGLAKLIAHRTCSARSVVEAHLSQIHTVNPQLNAVVQLCGKRALREADEADTLLATGKVKGPLHGVPVTIKDTLDTAGIISTAGTLGRKDYIPLEDATSVARLRAAGAIVLGKTNVPELAVALETDNLIYGRTNNPYALDRTAGGSAGGESAIVAAFGSPVGLGTDAGGSIRIPAHFCGLAAIKPTAGRIPRTGQFPPPLGARASLFHISLISRSVADLGFILPIIAGPDFRDHAIVEMPLLDFKAVALSALKVAFYTDDGTVGPTDDIANAVQRSVSALRDDGVKICEARPSCVSEAASIYHDISRGDGGAGLRRLQTDIGTVTYSPLFNHALQFSLAPDMDSRTAVLDAFVRWDKFRNTMMEFMGGFDAIISPVLPFTALRHGKSFESENRAALGYCQAHNLTGWRATTVRVGTSDEGLPIGVQIVAQPWREDIALALASVLEDRLGGFGAPPIV